MSLIPQGSNSTFLLLPEVPLFTGVVCQIQENVSRLEYTTNSLDYTTLPPLLSDGITRVWLFHLFELETHHAELHTESSSVHIFYSNELTTHLDKSGSRSQIEKDRNRVQLKNHGHPSYL